MFLFTSPAGCGTPVARSTAARVWNGPYRQGVTPGTLEARLQGAVNPEQRTAHSASDVLLVPPIAEFPSQTDVDFAEEGASDVD